MTDEDSLNYRISSKKVENERTFEKILANQACYSKATGKEKNMLDNILKTEMRKVEGFILDNLDFLGEIRPNHLLGGEKTWPETAIEWNGKEAY